MRLRWMLAALAVVLPLTSAVADPLPRIAVLTEAKVDGKASDGAALLDAVNQVLLDAGFPLVAQDRLKAVRQTIDLEGALNGKLPTELSALDAMREHVEVLGLAYEDISADDMKVFLKLHPVVYPIAVVDTFNPPADFATPRGLPMTYLIAPDGRVADKFLGPVTAKDIEAAIAKAGGPQAAGQS